MLDRKFLRDVSSKCALTTDNQRQILEQIAEASNVPIQFSDRLGKLVNSQIRKLRAKLKQTRGGSQQAKILSSTWEFSLLPGELVYHKVIQERDYLKKSLSTSNSARAYCRLQAKCKKQNARILKLSQKLLAKAKQKKTRGRKRSGSYSLRYQKKLRASQVEDCKTSLLWLSSEGLIPQKLTVTDVGTGNVDHLILTESDDGNSLPTVSVSADSAEVAQTKISQLIFAKDSHNISDRAYSHLAKIEPSLPRLSQVKKQVNELNAKYEINSLPNGVTGVQQSLSARLIERIKNSSSQALATTFPDNIVRIKLSGDGTNVGKHIHLVNFTFTLVDGLLAGSCEGNHVLAIIECEEKYETLALALADIVQEVNELHKSGIEVDGVHYKIECYLGGDWKFLAIITGINSASGRYACIWCKCPAEDRHDVSKKWSITDPKFGARSIEESISISKLPNSRRSFGIKFPPLFTTIPLSHVVVDNLHMFLRIADTLINLLIVELRRLDALEKVKKFTTFDRSKAKSLAQWEAFLTSLEIRNGHFYVDKDSKELKWKTLTGPEKIRVFKNIKMNDILTNSPTLAIRLQSLWTNFMELYLITSKPCTDIQKSSFGSKASSWLEAFLDIYQTKNVTPYIHTMVQHVPQFLELYGSIVPFTQQGLEKFNDITTKDYFRSSNHRKEEALRQVVYKKNRVDLLRGTCNDLYQQKTCSNCNKKGHNKRTCTKTNRT